MKTVACLVLACTLGSLSAVAGAEIYRWTDAAGRVHFGDRPKDADRAESVEVRDYKPGTDEAVRQVYERSDRLRDATKAVDPLQRKAEAARAAEQAAACEQAHERLRRLSGPVRFVDDSGKPVRATERDRVAQQRETESWIAANCR